MSRTTEPDGFTPRRWVWIALYSGLGASVALLVTSIVLLAHP